MSFLDRLIRLFNCWAVSPNLTPAETQVWRCIVESGSPEQAEVFEKQHSQLLEAHRNKQADGYMAYFVYRYPIERVSERRDRELAKLNGASDGMKLRLRVFVGGGFISQLFVEGGEIQNPWKLALTSIEVESIADLMNVPQPKLSGWVAALHEEGLLAEIGQPLERGEREAFLEGKSFLPREYVELTEQTNGALIGEFALLGLDELAEFEIGSRKGVFLIDMRDLGAIGVMADTGELRHISGEGDEGERIPFDFRRVVEAVAKDTFFDELEIP